MRLPCKGKGKSSSERKRKGSRPSAFAHAPFATRPASLTRAACLTCSLRPYTGRREVMIGKLALARGAEQRKRRGMKDGKCARVFVGQELSSFFRFFPFFPPRGPLGLKLKIDFEREANATSSTLSRPPPRAPASKHSFLAPSLSPLLPPLIL